MKTAASKCKSVWQAEVTREKRFYTSEERTPKGETSEAPEGETVETIHMVWDYFVEVNRPGGERIRFRVSHRKGRRVTFSDTRERSTGTAGTTGLWGTRPGQRAGQPRSLTPTGFRMEVARLIGAERAEEIIRTILAQDFFCHDL